MPNWKKVIVSGSDASLNSLNVTTALTASGLIYPTVDGTANQVIQTDGLGNLSFGSVDTTYEVVKNVAGTTLYKGTPVHATASNASGNVVGIIAASASNPATMPATFILNEDLADGVEGYAIISGLIQGVDTSAFEEGDVVYVGENSGYTNVKPTGSNLIQNLGIVTKIHPSNGAGIVLGAGRSNDVPNLLNGEVFWGEGNRAIKKPLADILSGSSYIYSGSFSGSFQGDGSGLTGIQVASLQSNFNVTSFTNTGSITINHNLNATYPLVQVYDNTNNQIIPDSVEIIDSNNVKISFVSQRTGNVVIGKGGDIIDLTQILPPTTRAVTGSFTSVTSSIITHNLQTENILVSVYDNTKNYIIPDSIQILDSNNVQVGFSAPTTGYAVVTNGGHIVSGSIDWTNVLNKPSGLVSSSAQISITESQISDLTHYTDSDVLDYLTTGVGGHILPSTTETYDLGSPTKKWRDLYLSGSTIYLGDTKLTSGDSGSLEVKDVNDNILPIVAKSIHVGDGTNMVEIRRDSSRGTIKFLSSTMQETGELVSSDSIVVGTYSGSFTGSFVGDGSKLSGVTSYTDSDTLSYINTLGIISSSAQISSEISGAFFESANTILQSYYLNTNRLTNLESKTLISGSSQVSYTDVSNVPDGIISSSAQLSNATIPGNLTIDGVLTAQEFRTEFVSASIIYQSGSTKFRDTSDDTHTFLGTLSATTIQNVLSSSAQIDYNAIPNRITNNNQLTNGAGYTTCVGDITGVTAGTGLSGGGTSGTVTVYHGNTSTLTGAQGTTGIASISVDSYGHVTAVTTATYCTTDTNTTYTANEMLTCIKTVDGTGSGLDADLLDGQQGSYYLDYNNFTNKPTIPTNNNQLTNGAGYTTCVGDITGVTAGTGLTGGGTSGTVTVSHADTSTLTGAQGSAGIASITVDALGHVTAVTTATYCTTDTNTTYTANEMLTCIKTVDGTGSGLDADTLDGQQGSYYLDYNNFTNKPTIPTNNNQLTNGAGYTTCTGTLTGTGTSGYISKWNGSTSQTNSIIYDNGTNVGIGTTNPSAKLDVIGNSNIDGDLTVTGKVTAQEFHTEFVSASIVFQSGSTQFGNSSDDTHTFLGTLSATTIQNVLSSSAQIDYNAIPNRITNNNQLTNGAGYITEVTNISGYAYQLHMQDNRAISPSELTCRRLSFGFTSWNNNSTSPYADFLHLRSYGDSSGGSDNLIMFKKSGIGMRIWQQSWGSTSAYSTCADVWHTGNHGAGSGLDADLLDGQQGSYYLDYNNFTNKPTIPTNNNQLTNGAGYTTCTGTVSSWAGIPAGTRCNYTLKFQPPASNYAGFQFLGTNSAGAGYLIIRGTSDTGGTYTAEGISLVADQGWLTLAQRYTSGRGVRILTNNNERLVVDFDGTVRPGANGTQNLGSSTYRWNTVYTSDLSLKNDVGDWTIVEGEEDLFLYNNKKDKVYKFNLTEVDKESAPKKRS